jgi:hypothetical protein
MKSYFIKTYARDQDDLKNYFNINEIKSELGNVEFDGDDVTVTYSASMSGVDMTMMKLSVPIIGMMAIPG